MYFLIGGFVLLNVYLITNKLYKCCIKNNNEQFDDDLDNEDNEYDSDNSDCNNSQSDSNNSEKQSDSDDSNDSEKQSDSDDSNDSEKQSDSDDDKKQDFKNILTNKLNKFKQHLVKWHDKCFKYNMLDDLDLALNKINKILDKIDNKELVDYSMGGEVMETINIVFDIYIKLYNNSKKDHFNVIKELLKKMESSDNKLSDDCSCNKCEDAENKYGQTILQSINMCSNTINDTPPINLETSVEFSSDKSEITLEKNKDV